MAWVKSSMAFAYSEGQVGVAARGVDSRCVRASGRWRCEVLRWRAPAGWRRRRTPAACGVRFGVAGLTLDGLIEIGRGLVAVAGCQVVLAARAPCRGVGGVGLDRFRVRGDGLIAPARLVGAKPALVSGLRLFLVRLGLPRR
jgi:hypothetical protein